MWTTESRQYFFKQSDESFIERYCSTRTKNHISKNRINVSDLRNILDCLSAFIPELEHSTPGWSFVTARSLLVVLGKSHLQWRPAAKNSPVQVIRKPRFGLCGFEGSIHLWTDKKFIANPNNPYFGNFNTKDWTDWPQSDGKIYFKSPLNDGEGKINDELFTEGQPLWYLIEAIGDKLSPDEFILQEVFAERRRFHGLPEEFAVFYPKLSEQLQSNKPTIGPSLPDTSNTIEPKEFTEKSKNVPEAFQANDLAETAKNIYHTLGEEQQLTDSGEIVGRYYVYALVDPTNLNKPFYIGKGFHDRALQHFRVVNNYNQQSSDTIVEQADDKFEIGEDSKKILSAESQIDISEPKTAKINELINKQRVNPNDIARVIARGLPEQVAFSIEAFMIKHVYGLACLTNSVSGQHDERFRSFNEWNYIDGYDLSTDEKGELIADQQIHAYGEFYVYVLRDPATSEIFYVGKGKGNRLCQHFYDARSNAPQYQNIERIERLSGLLQSYKPNEIGRIVARVQTETQAYLIESFYIKFVIGFRNLTNVQPGHLSGMFRSNGDWERRHGFDLPAHPGGNYRNLRDIFLGEGLDTLIYEVLQQVDLRNQLLDITSPALVGAGELAIQATIKNVDESVKLQIHVRCARRIQVFLIPINNLGRAWIKNKFGSIARYPLHRIDDRFRPQCWWGTNNMTSDPIEAASRAVRMVQLAQALQCEQSNKEDFNRFEDLLKGLPSINQKKLSCQVLPS